MTEEKPAREDCLHLVMFGDEWGAPFAISGLIRGTFYDAVNDLPFDPAPTHWAVIEPPTK